jgi:hypothetical protein
MKNLFIISFLLLVGGYGFGQDLVESNALSAGGMIVTDGKLEIIIHETSTLVDNKYHIIGGLIIIDKRIPTKDNSTKSNINSINKPNTFYKKLNSFDFSKLKNSYVDNAAADSDLEYDLTIKLNGETYNIHIYKLKVKPIYKLVKLINRQLLEQDKIGYNKSYFE